MAFVATTLPVNVGLAVFASHLALAAASVAVADMRSGATRRAATAPSVRANEKGLIFVIFVNLSSRRYAISSCSWFRLTIRAHTIWRLSMKPTWQNCIPTRPKGFFGHKRIKPDQPRIAKPRRWGSRDTGRNTRSTPLYIYTRTATVSRRH